MFLASGDTHAVCLLHWGKVEASFLLQYVAWAVAYLGGNMDLVAQYCHLVGCLTSHAATYI